MKTKEPSAKTSKLAVVRQLSFISEQGMENVLAYIRANDILFDYNVPPHIRQQTSTFLIGYLRMVYGKDFVELKLNDVKDISDVLHVNDLVRFDGQPFENIELCLPKNTTGMIVEVDKGWLNIQPANKPIHIVNFFEYLKMFFSNNKKNKEKHKNSKSQPLHMLPLHIKWETGKGYIGPDDYMSDGTDIEIIATMGISLPNNIRGKENVLQAASAGQEVRFTGESILTAEYFLPTGSLGIVTGINLKEKYALKIFWLYSPYIINSDALNTRFRYLHTSFTLLRLNPLEQGIEEVINTYGK